MNDLGAGLASHHSSQVRGRGLMPNLLQHRADPAYRNVGICSQRPALQQPALRAAEVPLLQQKRNPTGQEDKQQQQLLAIKDTKLSYTCMKETIL